MSLPVEDAERLLRLHDRLLRGEAELARAERVSRLGPLWLGWYGDRGFVSYHDLGGLRGAGLARLIAAAVDHFSQAGATSFEWKTRGHDWGGAELDAMLCAADLEPEPVETVMIGEPSLLEAASALPDGLGLRAAGGSDAELAADVAAVGRLHAELFAQHDAAHDHALLSALRSRPEHTQLWLIEDGTEVVCAGRLELQGSVAGLWGGGTAARWRGRGLYRTLTAARARAAAQAGCELIYAECTPLSRPILQRAGLAAITTTTPYVWRAESRSSH